MQIFVRGSLKIAKFCTNSNSSQSELAQFAEEFVQNSVQKFAKKLLQRVGAQAPEPSAVMAAMLYALSKSITYCNCQPWAESITYSTACQTFVRDGAVIGDCVSDILR